MHQIIKGFRNSYSSSPLAASALLTNIKSMCHGQRQFVARAIVNEILYEQKAIVRAVDKFIKYYYQRRCAIELSDVQIIKLGVHAQF